MSSRLSLADRLSVPVASFFPIPPNDADDDDRPPEYKLLSVTDARVLLEVFGRLNPRQRRLRVDVAEAMPGRD